MTVTRNHLRLVLVAALVLVALSPFASAAGDGATRITTHPALDGAPSWSPDGSQIAFGSKRSGNYDIWVIPAAGGIATQITTHRGDDLKPAWSPDGSQIAFYSTRSGLEDIWAIPATGGTATRITTDPEYDLRPSWSPDGSQIAFDSRRSGNFDIWVIPATGGTATQITTHSGTDFIPAWSPDGSQIAFSSNRNGNTDIWVIPVTGGPARQLTTNLSSDFTPSWSPDGSQIVFERRFSGIYVIPATGGTETQITTSGFNPEWSPDGTLIAFNDRGDIWVIDAPQPPSPSEMLTELIEQTGSFHLPMGIQRSLLAKLYAAERAIDRGNENAASRQLSAFTNQVSAQRGHHIDEDDADMLIASAETIIAVLDTRGGPTLGGGKWQPALKSPDDTSGIQLSASHPNPFSQSTTVAFALPQASAVRITVYDVAGRLIRTLLDDQRPQGHHTAAWDGRDAAGLRMTAGTYFVRLTAGDVTRTRKVVFLGGN